MSYVRWSSPGHPWDYDSDLYIYNDVSGGITCCGCDLEEPNHSTGYNVATHEEMIAHVEKHIKEGDSVPDFVIPRLEERRGFN